MTQLLQSIYAIGPYLFILVLMGAALCGVWLITELRKSPDRERFGVGDTMFLKRNASRLRKMELH
ncbi:hypothetical protein [Dyadobacter psychrophilus]|uniref:Uncharacterized protein n=1 Tax=Dyadobacter psychrophilus TaxID=651661 RepID=A0A1T5F926_9BACT|nr:hypothetical protein [Dyadobacter psychrophilus]SKB92679.1 hypothetical protein SAMN05660293_02901 [Dyadobacter psychrophilus]